MIKSMSFVWVLGLFTIVPYCLYYLFFEASRNEYAFFLTLLLFWIFGFWALVGPIISILKIRSALRFLEQMDSKDKLEEMIRNKEAQQVILDFMVSENNVPMFIAKMMYKYLIRKLTQ